MTIGIYALQFIGTDKIYVGQSINIERRFTTHMREMNKNVHINCKVQETYNLYKQVSLQILEITNIEKLTEREIYWIKILNTIEDGLNITYPSIGASHGPYFSNSKFSKLEIIKVFRHSYLQTYSGLSYKDIADKLNVPTSLINNIRSGKNHLWLASLYPYQYTKMRNLVGTRNNMITGKTYSLRSPTMEIHEFTSITSFSNLHKLDRGNLNRIINGKGKSCKGWTKI